MVCRTVFDRWLCLLAGCCFCPACCAGGPSCLSGTRSSPLGRSCGLYHSKSDVQQRGLDSRSCLSAPTTLLFPGRAKTLSKNDDPKSARKFFGRSVLSVRRVGLQVGCVLTRFARARARKHDRWQLGSRARANPFLMFVSEFVR